MKDTLRNAIGITQKQLAEYLDTTRVTLAREEQFIRSLSDEAGFKKQMLTAFILTTPAKPVDKVVHFEAEEAIAFDSWLNNRLILGKLELLKAQRLLERQKFRYEQCCRAVQLADATIPTIVPDGPVAEKDKRWFKIIEYEALQKMQDCGKMTQYRTQLAIGLLEKELKELEITIAERQMEN